MEQIKTIDELFKVWNRIVPFPFGMIKQIVMSREFIPLSEDEYNFVFNQFKIYLNERIKKANTEFLIENLEYDLVNIVEYLESDNIGDFGSCIEPKASRTLNLLARKCANEIRLLDENNLKGEIVINDKNTPEKHISTFSQPEVARILDLLYKSKFFHGSYKRKHIATVFSHLTGYKRPTFYQTISGEKIEAIREDKEIIKSLEIKFKDILDNLRSGI